MKDHRIYVTACFLTLISKLIIPLLLADYDALTIRRYVNAIK
jgi:hypothetical protein